MLLLLEFYGVGRRIRQLCLFSGTCSNDEVAMEKRSFVMFWRTVFIGRHPMISVYSFFTFVSSSCGRALHSTRYAHFRWARSAFHHAHVISSRIPESWWVAKKAVLCLSLLSLSSCPNVVRSHHGEFNKTDDKMRERSQTRTLKTFERVVVSSSYVYQMTRKRERERG